MRDWIWERFRLNRERLTRMIADAILVSGSLLVALTLRYLWLSEVEHFEGEEFLTLGSYVAACASSIWLVTPLAAFIFMGSGFYSRGRHYQSRYKLLIILQAVTVVYVLFGFFTYLVPHVFDLPRGALVVAWALTVAVLVAARLWAAVWARVVFSETSVEQQLQVLGQPRLVLVIGGAGYIGSALLPKLLDKGFRVRVLDLLLYGDEPIRQWVGHPNLEIVQADFRHVDKVVEAMKGVGAVIHLGAIVGDPACALDESLTISVNLMATRMIAEVAKGCGVGRFIFASTCSVYGASDELLDERSLLNPVSLYARSKIASERVLMKMADSAFAPVILRFGTVFGLSGRTRFDLVVNLLTAKALTDRRITVSGGDQWRPFVHVDDVALAVLLSLEAPRGVVGGEVFNVGSDAQNYTIGQVGSLIKQLVPEAELVDMGSGGDRRNYRVSFRKIRTALGYKPQWTLTQGAQQVIEAFREGRVTDYQRAEYSNVKYLSEEGMSRLTDSGDDKWAQDLLEDTKTPIPLPARGVGQVGQPILSAG